MAQETLLHVTRSVEGKGSGGPRIHVCTAESPCCSPETITTLLSGCTPI